MDLEKVFKWTAARIALIQRRDLFFKTIQ